MSSPEDWCRDRLAKLQIKDLQKDTLSEIKDHLIKLSHQESIKTSNFLQLPAIFECVDSNQKEQTKLACDVLTICMTNLDLGETVNNHSNLLEKSLYHDNPDVQLMGLNELNRIAQLQSNIISDTNLIIAAIKTIDSKDTGVGTACVTFLSKILPNFIDIHSIKLILEEYLNNSDNIVKCRVYEVAVNLSRTNNFIEKMDFVLSKMIADINESNDILYRLNLFEILSNFAITEHSLNYLESKNCFSMLLRLADDSTESPLLVPGLIKFFGAITVHQPEKMFNEYPAIITLLLDCIISNSNDLPIAYDTLGFIGKSVDGKQFLNSIPDEKMKIVLKEISTNITSFPTELKIRALNCLTDLFSSETPENNKVSYITETWYSYLSPQMDDLNFVVAFCKNPFPDIKIGGLNLLKSLIIHKWGQKFLKQTAGFIEYLLDRKVEFDQNAILLKYGIIRILADSKNFDNDTLNQFKKYVMEGSVYVEGVTEVALEGAE